MQFYFYRFAISFDRMKYTRREQQRDLNKTNSRLEIRFKFLFGLSFALLPHLFPFLLFPSTFFFFSFAWFFLLWLIFSNLIVIIERNRFKLAMARREKNLASVSSKIDSDSDRSKVSNIEIKTGTKILSYFSFDELKNVFFFSFPVSFSLLPDFRFRSDEMNEK